MDANEWRECADPIQMINTLGMTRREIVALLGPVVLKTLENEGLNHAASTSVFHALGMVAAWENRKASSHDVEQAGLNMLHGKSSLSEEDPEDLAILSVYHLCTICYMQPDAPTHHERIIQACALLDLEPYDRPPRASENNVTALDEQIAFTIAAVADVMAANARSLLLRQSLASLKLVVRGELRMVICDMIRELHPHPEFR